ncbi:MAG: UDP-N-acetylglucosamine 2-epimerase, partial [Acidobacteria bacterium]|nr:UDP-N-acetylglucosamine 2-epimerase [Acidobacteriota bacterium]
TANATVKSMALALNFFSDIFSRRKIDLILVLGDRFEMHSAALAALPFNIPVAHIHGGELTYGAIDDSLRHSITKLSHLHFVATEEYRKRVIQLGENPTNVIVSGAPSLDNLKKIKIFTLEELEQRLNTSLKKFFLVTLHPETIGKVDNKKNATVMFEALKEWDYQLVVTFPNADAKNIEIREVIEKYAKENEKIKPFDNLGTQTYFSLMNYASAMVGNSSSGVIEAMSFKLPVVNIGERQKGRARNANVIDCPFDKKKITYSLKVALSDNFREKIKKSTNIYYKENSSKIIVDALEKFMNKKVSTMKTFYDIKRL